MVERKLKTYQDTGGTKFQRESVNNGLLNKMAFAAYSTFLLPKKAAEKTFKGLQSIKLLVKAEQARRKTHKIRYPRFISYNRELEPYNVKKARAQVNYKQSPKTVFRTC